MQQAILDLIDKHIYWLSVVNTEWEPQEEYHSEWQLSLMKLRNDVVALWDGWIPVTEKNPIWKCIAIRMSEWWEYFVNAWFSESSLDWWIQNEKWYTTTIDKFDATHWKPIWPLPLSPNK